MFSIEMCPFPFCYYPKVYNNIIVYIQVQGKILRVHNPLLEAVWSRRHSAKHENNSGNGHLCLLMFPSRRKVLASVGL